MSVLPAPRDRNQDRQANVARLYRNGRHCVVNGYQAVKFQGAKRDCRACHLRERCLKHPERTETRQVYFFAKWRCPMKDYLDRIFSAKTTDEVCTALQKALDSLRAKKYFAKISDYYQEIGAGSPTEVQEWFDEMKDDDQANEEGNLKEIYGV
jgi:hypothetical protein